MSFVIFQFSNFGNGRNSFCNLVPLQHYTLHYNIVTPHILAKYVIFKAL